MDEKNKNSDRKDPSIHKNVPKILSTLIKALRLETFTLPGRVNIAALILLAVIIVMYFLTNTFVSVARVVATIWNGAMTEQTEDNIVTLLIVFVACAVLCIIMIYRTQKGGKSSYRSEEQGENETD